MRPIMRQYQRHLLSALVVLVTLLSGCYTVLRHPPVQRESYLSSEITHRDACNSCHTGFGVFSYEDPLRPAPPYTSPKLQDWNYYYHYPWWLDDVYYVQDSGAKGGETPLPIDPRRLGNRRGTDAYVPNTAPAGAGSGTFFRKQSTTADSAKKTQPQVTPRKPKADRSHLNSAGEKAKRSRKKKKNH